MAVIRKLDPNREDIDFKPPEVNKYDRFNQGHDESNWLISYADMMTLLCVFYIMMFSMAKINTVEFEKMKQQVAEHFGSKYESPTEDLGKFVTNILTETGVSKDATLTSDGVSVSIAFHSTLFFDTMSAEILAPGKEILSKVITGLDEHQKSHGKNYKIVVEGHTDSQPILGGPFPSNWELSSGRATRVIRLFLEKGFQASQLLAIGYADTQPVAESRNADGTWNLENLGKNRRVVLRVLLPEVDSIPWKVAPSGIKDTAPQPALPTTEALSPVNASEPAVVEVPSVSTPVEVK